MQGYLRFIDQVAVQSIQIYSVWDNYRYSAHVMS